MGGLDTSAPPPPDWNPGATAELILVPPLSKDRPMSPLQLPLLIGFVVMSLASLAIYATGSKVPEWRHHTHSHSIVPFIAATSYLAMTLGTGILSINGDETLFLARYVDWSITTPVLLTGLTLTALHEHHRHSGYVVSIIILDALMIVAGLLAAISTVPAIRWIWYIWSCVAFLGVLYMIWGPLRRWSEEYGGRLNTIYKTNATFLTAVWVLYPVEFFLGPQGIRAFGTVGDAWAIVVLDITAKVVYGWMVVGRFKGLPVEAGERDNTTDDQPAGQRSRPATV